MTRHPGFLPLLLGLAGLLGACGGGNEQIVRWRQDLAAKGSTVIRADVGRTVDALFRALEDGKNRLDQGEAPFAALEAVRLARGLDGLEWTSDDGRGAWAGRALDPVPRDAPPWRESFRHGRLAYRDGPFVKALVAGPIAAAGGRITATAILESHLPGDRSRPFESRWLEPLHLERVSLTAPTAAETVDDAATAFLVDGEDGPALRVVVEPPPSEAVADLIEEASRGWRGLLLLLGGAVLLVLGGLVLRRVAPPALRLLCAAILVLAARLGLGLVDLPGRWPALGPAFEPNDFGIEDPLGWLASPGAFAISALFGLLAAVFLSLAIRRARPLSSTAGRVALGVAATLLAGWIGALVVRLVGLVISESQTPFFDAASFVPPLASTLLLVGLLATMAGAWLLVSALLARAAACVRPLGNPWRAVPPALLAAGVACLLAPSGWPWWMVALLPLAALLAWIRPGREEISTVASAALLVGVLATVLLFPILWRSLLTHRGEMLGAALDDLIQREAGVESATELELELLREDEDLKEALRAAAKGPRPEGIAFHLWLQSILSEPGEHGVVTVLDPEGRLLDEFTLTPLPRNRMPAPAPPASGAGDLQLVNPPAENRSLRTVVGRVRIRDDDERVLGSVVLTIPEPVDLALSGLRARGGATGDEPYRIGVRTFDLSYAVIDRGKIVKSNDQSIPLGSEAFGPPELASLNAAHDTFAWRDDDVEGHAAWSSRRDAVIAVRRATPSHADTVLALARLVTLGVGLALVIAVITLLVNARSLRPRLMHRLMLSYFAISFLPIVLLGLATAREVRIRHEASLEQRLSTDVRRARSDLEDLGGNLFDLASDNRLVRWADEGRPDLFLYRDGDVIATSRAGLVEAEVLPARLPADAYVATIEERRELVGRDATLAGRAVWFAYAPILDARGRVLATVGIPLLEDRDRVAEDLAVTGNVLVAAYLFALVLVLVGGLWAARRLTSPVRLLAAGTRRVTAGELDVVLRPEGRDELGELVAAFNVMTQALRQANERAARAERESAWRRMARQVAHEIKNPLTPIRLMIQQMEAESERDPERAPEAIRMTAPVVLRQIEALGKIARDFSHFARMPQRDLREVEVGPLLEDVVALHGGDPKVAVQGDIAGDLPTVRWDETELRRVLINVLGNAVQAVDGEGRVDVRARPETRGVRKGVQIEIRDTGVGIPAPDLKRIFEPDFSTKTQGTGLGLAMVRRAVEDLGGEIEVTSEEGRGTTFRLWWPA